MTLFTTVTKRSPTAVGRSLFSLDPHPKYWNNIVLMNWTVSEKMGLFSPLHEKMARNMVLTALKKGKSMIGRKLKVAIARRTNQEVLVLSFYAPSFFLCPPCVPTFPKWPPSCSLVVDKPVEYFCFLFVLFVCFFYVVFPSGLFLCGGRRKLQVKSSLQQYCLPHFHFWVFCGSLVYLLCAASHTCDCYKHT